MGNRFPQPDTSCSQPGAAARFHRERNPKKMREAVVVASSRTALAKSFRGSFNLTRPDDLAAHCIKDVLGKVPQLDKSEIEDVIMGCAQPNGAQGNNVARVALLRAAFPSAWPAPPSTASARRGSRPSPWPPTRSSWAEPRP